MVTYSPSSRQSQRYPRWWFLFEISCRIYSDTSKTSYVKHCFSWNSALLILLFTAFSRIKAPVWGNPSSLTGWFHHLALSSRFISWFTQAERYAKMNQNGSGQLFVMFHSHDTEKVFNVGSWLKARVDNKSKPHCSEKFLIIFFVLSHLLTNHGFRLCFGKCLNFVCCKTCLFLNKWFLNMHIEHSSRSQLSKIWI